MQQQAGSSDTYQIVPSGNIIRIHRSFQTSTISTCRHERGDHITEEVFDVRVVFPHNIWALLVFLSEALLHRDLYCL